MSDLQVSVQYGSTLNTIEVQHDEDQPATTSEFESFADLTGRLLRVSKDELDDKLKNG